MKLKKVIVIVILTFSGSLAHSQSTQVDPKLFESMYKECANERHNKIMIVDYYAALNLNLKNKIEELEKKLKEYEK